MVLEPRHAHYPKMKYPRSVQKQIKKYEDTVKAWAIEDDEYAVCEQALKDAEAADKLAFKQAAVAGEPDPGATATETARRALAYQEERVNAAVREVNKEAAALNRTFQEHREELIEEACVQAEETMEEFRRGVASIYAQSREVTAQRDRGLAALRWVSGLMDGSLRYDPSFPMSGDFKMPNTAELKVSGIVTLLRKFFTPLDKDGEAA